MYAFALSSLSDWTECLDRQGFVVLRGVLSPQEALEAARDFRDILVTLSVGRLDPNDPTTFQNAWNYPRSVLGTGLFRYIGYTKVQGRLRKAVKPIFATLWNTEDLMTSLEGFKYASGKTGYSDVLRNLKESQTKDKAVRGAVNLLPCLNVLTVVPGSHLGDTDTDTKALAVRAGPGDVVLWDARLCVQDPPPGPGQPAKILQYVTQMPKAQVPENIRRNLSRCFLKRRCSSWDGSVMYARFPEFGDPCMKPIIRELNLKCKRRLNHIDLGSSRDACIDTREGARPHHGRNL
jgi:hypothetical protein